jgi:SAM-dependent methyltransferase
MAGTQDEGNAQAALWNGPAGRAWVGEQQLLDRLYAPFRDWLVEAVAAEGATAVLDVGCGAGDTTLAIARHLDGGGHATGIDISAPLITAARARAERDGVPARFVIADAQEHPFEPDDTDMIVSRFGVMFFGDPIRAFANLRRAARAAAPLRAIAWRSAAENPFMTAAEQAAAALLPDLPPRQPGGPGQFAFADAQRVRGILADSGWQAIEIQPLEVECRLSEPDLLTYVTRLGPVGLALQDADDGTREAVVAAARAAVEPFMTGGECRFTAACWSIGARA